jgi:hypothetical protein
MDSNLMDSSLAMGSSLAMVGNLVDNLLTVGLNSPAMVGILTIRMVGLSSLVILNSLAIPTPMVGNLLTAGLSSLDMEAHDTAALPKIIRRKMRQIWPLACPSQ